MGPIGPREVCEKCPNYQRKHSSIAAGKISKRIEDAASNYLNAFSEDVGMQFSESFGNG